MDLDKDFERQVTQDYRLTMANIFYHLPDHPDLLQEYIWQDYDIAPKFPVLNEFLGFWHNELDGKLHSVYVASKKIITPGEFVHCNVEFTLQ